MQKFLGLNTIFIFALSTAIVATDECPDAAKALVSATDVVEAEAIPFIGKKPSKKAPKLKANPETVRTIQNSHEVLKSDGYYFLKHSSGVTPIFEAGKGELLVSQGIQFDSPDILTVANGTNLRVFKFSEGELWKEASFAAPIEDVKLVELRVVVGIFQQSHTHALVYAGGYLMSVDLQGDEPKLVDAYKMAKPDSIRVKEETRIATGLPIQVRSTIAEVRHGEHILQLNLDEGYLKAEGSRKTDISGETRDRVSKLVAKLVSKLNSTVETAENDFGEISQTEAQEVLLGLSLMTETPLAAISSKSIQLVHEIQNSGGTPGLPLVQGIMTVDSILQNPPKIKTQIKLSDKASDLFEKRFGIGSFPVSTYLIALMTEAKLKNVSDAFDVFANTIAATRDLEAKYDAKMEERSAAIRKSNPLAGLANAMAEGFSARLQDAFPQLPTLPLEFLTAITDVIQFGGLKTKNAVDLFLEIIEHKRIGNFTSHRLAAVYKAHALRGMSLEKAAQTLKNMEYLTKVELGRELTANEEKLLDQMVFLGNTPVEEAIQLLIEIEASGIDKKPFVLAILKAAAYSTVTDSVSRLNMHGILTAE